MFEHQVDSFLLHQQPTDDSPISPLGDYDEYDHADDLGDPNNTDDNHSGYASRHRTPQALDGSGMDGLNPEDVPILLPSSLGWECMARDAYCKIQQASVNLQDLLKLHAEDLRVATLVLGSEPVGQQ
ncbi:hypothetical protein EDB89DRAFT_1907143 [Lactarius sanguifluus]|nr:hypothetical protein EDB89DRAFT_1907143 [Lactarius sanguifluus]